MAKYRGRLHSAMATEGVKRALLIAYHYPPAKGSSGIQRTLSFSRYLRENAWEPIVLSAHHRAYPETSNDQLSDIPENVELKRAFALDTARHLSFRGKYVSLLAYPDRWIAWWFGSIIPALRLIRRYRPSVIWSTYPIATAHLIGLTIHRITGIPWVADFRDSMTEEHYPPDRSRRRVCQWIERRVVSRAAMSVFTAPSAVTMYVDRYPHIDRSRFRCILNGYDEEKFSVAENPASPAGAEKGKRVLLHSGILYPSERDPTEFFGAIKQLKDENRGDLRDFEIRLRATGHDDYLQRKIDDFDIADSVKLLPTLGYSDALKEMMQADGLLLFQASDCNHQIPAKLYEYLRAGRPILALTDPTGDTAKLLFDAGISSVVRLDSQSEIVDAMRNFLNQIKSNTIPRVSDTVVSRYSRRNQTKELAKLFDTLTK